MVFSGQREIKQQQPWASQTTNDRCILPSRFKQQCFGHQPIGKSQPFPMVAMMDGTWTTWACFPPAVFECQKHWRAVVLKLHRGWVDFGHKKKGTVSAQSEKSKKVKMKIKTWKKRNNAKKKKHGFHLSLGASLLSHEPCQLPRQGSGGTPCSLNGFTSMPSRESFRLPSCGACYPSTTEPCPLKNDEDWGWKMMKIGDIMRIIWNFDGIYN